MIIRFSQRDISHELRAIDFPENKQVADNVNLGNFDSLGRALVMAIAGRCWLRRPSLSDRNKFFSHCACALPFASVSRDVLASTPLHVVELQ